MLIKSSISLLVVLALSTFVSAVPTVKAVGSKFFTSDGNQWFVKGIAYQLIEDDPLISVGQCTRDAALMKQLGANAIRVYHVDATADHSGCMKVFADAGIYLFVDLDSFKTYIRYDTTPSWTQNKSDSYRAVMDNFQQYDNTAGFFVGNEVLNSLVDSTSAPFLLTAVADLKTYRSAKGYREIPIGYSATDTGALPMLQDYLVCRPNVTERLEFYALNSYRWCGSQTVYSTSGYDQLQKAAAGYPIPIFFSETGCNQVPPRDFGDQVAIFGPEMENTWSGAIVYEWIQELNQYGLVSYGPQLGAEVQIGSSVVQGFTRQGVPTPIQPDFNNLQSRWASVKPTGIASSNYVKAITSISRTCPAYTATGWVVDPSAPLPTLDQTGVAGAVSTSSVTSRAVTSTTSSHSTTRTSTSVTASASTGAASKAATQFWSLPALEVGVLGMSGSLAFAVAVVMCWL